MDTTEVTCDQRSVLVVDDAVEVREALVQLLSDEGYRVDSAANGQEAMERLQISKPCVILLDLMMPVMNGWELSSKLRESSETASIPLLILSADGRVATKAEAIGADGYIAKPFDLDVLLNAVAIFC